MSRLHPFDLSLLLLARRLNPLRVPLDRREALAIAAADWEAVIGLASRQFVLAALAAVVRDLVPRDLLDLELREFLEAVHAANLERNRALRGQLLVAGGALNRVGIEPVLLKGAIRLVDGLYPDPGWRMMEDLDILVPAAQVDAAVRALSGLGYRPVRPFDPAHKEVKLWGPGRALVEAHTELFASPRQQRLLTGSDMIATSKPCVLDGVRFRLPPVTQQMIHLIGHSQIGHFGHIYGRVSLRERLEAAALIGWSGAPIDWQAVHGSFARARYRRPLLAFLLALRDGDLSPAPLPERRDGLLALQEGRIGRQARSSALFRFSLHVGWWVVLVKIQLTQRRLLLTTGRLLVNPQARRRITRTLLAARLRPW